MTRRLSLSIASGAMLILSFAPFNVGFLAWVALIPLMFAVSGENPLRSFILGFSSGLVFSLGTVYWVVNSMHYYGGVPMWMSVPVMAALSAFLAVYIAVFALFFSATERTNPMARLMLAGTAWVSLEYLRAHLFTGFPWVLLGYSQTPYLQLIQIADVGGVWALSFIVVSVNSAVFFLARSLYERRGPIPLKEALVAAFLVISVFTYGVLRIRQVDKEAAGWRWMKAALAQGNIEQGVKWDASFQDKTLEIYRRLSLEASKTGAGLIVWPETAVPFYFPDDKEKRESVTRIVREAGSFVLTGSPSYNYNLEKGKVDYFNSAYLVTPQGEIAGGYDKVHLVPFGEYVPLKKVLFFVKKLTAGVGDFSSGAGPVPIAFEGGGAGVLICYEAIFPEIAAAEVRGGATVLVNITNDAWFGRSSAPYQHLEMSRMRAVENRVYLLRAANTGISAFIDPAGRVLKRSPLFEEAILVDRVAFRDGAAKTFYTRNGDLFAYGSMILTAVFILTGLIMRR